MKVYKKKPAEVMAVQVLKENLKEIKKIEEITFVELKNDKGEFDGIAISYLSAPKKTPKKVSAGDYLVETIGGIEKREKERFEADYE